MHFFQRIPFFYHHKEYNAGIMYTCNQYTIDYGNGNNGGWKESINLILMKGTELGFACLSNEI